jgi:hypothetical protein
MRTKHTEAILLLACGFLGLALFYLVMLNRWGINLWTQSIDYTKFGTLSNAVSGIGTTTALIVALASLLSQRAIHSRAEGRRAQEEETAVFQWTVSKELRDNVGKLIGRVWDVRIQNSTKAPIYHWKVDFDSTSEHLCNYSKRPLLPEENMFNLPFFDNLQSNAIPQPNLTFEGRSGRIWMRSARGVLTEARTKELECVHNSNA